MTVHILPLVRWNAAPSRGDPPADAGELSVLGAHFAHCNGCRGRWFSLRSAVESLDAFVAPRVVTTLMVAGAVVALAATTW